MITFKVNLDMAGATARMERTRALLADRGKLNATVESAAAIAVRKHLRANYEGRVNKLGGTSTGYWAKAIEGTRSISDVSGATVTVTQEGIRLKWTGGIITAGQSGKASEVTGKVPKFLTIPVHPAAHGKTIADLGGKAANYIVPFGAGGGLKEGGSSAGGGIFHKTGAKRSDNDPLYWILKRSVRIKADKNLLPPEAETGEAIVEALTDYFA